MLARLRQVVDQVGRAALNGSTESAEAVRSTQRRAELHLMGASGPHTDRPVWVIQGIGEFVNHRAMGPPRPDRPRQAPRYRAFIVIVDAVDFHFLSWGTSNEIADLTALGEPTRIDREPSPAQQSQHRTDDHRERSP